MKKLTLKDIRVGNGLTQTELGEIMGLSRDTIAKKESGAIALTVKDLRIIREHFKIDLNQVVD